MKITEITKEAQKQIEDNLRDILDSAFDVKIIENSLKSIYLQGRIDGIDYAIQAQKPIK